MNRTLLSKRPVNLQGHPGRELVFKTRIAGHSLEGTGKARFYLVGNRLYELIMIGFDSKAHPLDFDRFLTSFALLKSR